MTDIVSASLDLVDSFHAALDTVAREGRWLGSLEAQPISELRVFLQSCIALQNPAVFALNEGRVVGWCDITRATKPTLSHIGELGMGVVKGFRGQGIGARVLQAALDQAKVSNIPRVKLAVYANNTAAIALYRKFGFKEEGRMMYDAFIHGEYVDVLRMARIDLEALAAFRTI
jgi:RimJ/RimL family protein N-acetyltransferase